MNHSSFVLTTFLKPDNHKPKVHLGTVLGSRTEDLHLSGFQLSISNRPGKACEMLGA